nr:prepilin-type N-terminal cleavage/methylation domain-containing protein [Candidatus Gracilibacteria bacterium]
MKLHISGLNKSGFSLIEVVVSAIILSITVFGVYKLIAENNKIINNSNNFLDANVLLENTVNCLENIGFNTLKISNFTTQTGSFYFENTLTGKCSTGTFNTNFTFTGVKLNNIDYFLYGKIINSSSDYLDWNLGVFSDTTGKIEKEYKEWK